MHKLIKGSPLVLLCVVLTAVLTFSYCERMISAGAAKSARFAAERWSDMSTCTAEHAKRVYGPKNFKLTENELLGLLSGLFSGLLLSLVLFAASNLRISMR